MSDSSSRGPRPAPGDATSRPGGLAEFAADVQSRHTPRPGAATGRGTETTRSPRPPAAAAAAAAVDSAGAAVARRIRETLGLPEAATADEIWTAFESMMQGRDAARAAAPALPAGVVAVPRADLDQLRADATRPAEQERARVVDAAIARGAVTPAQREVYLRAMAVDPAGTTGTLTALPDSHAVPLGQLGHGYDAETTDATGWFPADPPRP